MIKIYLALALFLVGFISCQSNQTKENLTTTEQVLEEIMNLPDTILSSKNNKENEFQAVLSKLKINSDKTSLLAGDWQTISGTIEFFFTTLETNDKVIFYDTVQSSLTGWGIIRYNRSAQFYFTESGSYIYEYYILGINKLILTRYDYRNDDLTIKEKPEAVKKEIIISFLSNDKISLKFEGKTAELERR